MTKRKSSRQQWRLIDRSARGRMIYKTVDFDSEELARSFFVTRAQTSDDYGPHGTRRLTLLGPS